MKKLVMAALVLGAVGMATQSFADTELTFNISVTVRSGNINIYTDGTANNLSWGVLATNGTYVGTSPNTSTAVSPIFQLVNAGGTSINLQVEQQTPVADWTLLTSGAPGDARVDSEYRLFGVFTGYLTQTQVTDFAADDIITDSLITATSGVGATFAAASEGDDGYTGGFDVMPETYGGSDQYKGTRALQLCLDTPVTVPNENSQNIGLRITAVVN